MLLFYKLGKPGTKGKPGIKGNPGHFAMKFINLRSRQGKEASFITLPRDPRYYSKKKAYTFQVGSLKVNLRDGTFTIDPQEKDVVQNTALAFVTATLYLLVQPRPKDLKSIKDAKDGKKVYFLNNTIKHTLYSY